MSNDSKHSQAAVCAVLTPCTSVFVGSAASFDARLVTSLSVTLFPSSVATPWYSSMLATGGLISFESSVDAYLNVGLPA